MNTNDDKKIKGEETDDVVMESDNVSSDTGDVLDDSVVAEENSLETIKKLRLKIKELESKNSEYLSNWQRDKADFVNARKRDNLEKEQVLKYSNSSIIVDILRVIDNFDMAFANKESWEKIDKNWRSGMEFIYQDLKKVLFENGVKEIDPLGKTFDPNEHEAVEHVSVSEKEKDNTVISVIGRGYMLYDRIIRPAKVKVGDYKEV